MRALRAAVLAAALAGSAAGVARAREPARPGAREEVAGVLALRAAGATPFGDAVSRAPIRDHAVAGIPLGLELAARGASLTFGLALEWGRVFPAGCRAGEPCGGSLTRAGIELLHYFSPRGSRASTWVGAGLGWEGLSLRRAGGTLRLDSFEILSLQLGRELAVGRRVALGPFVGAALAQGMELDGEPIQDKSPHVWVRLGLRCAIDL